MPFNIFATHVQYRPIASTKGLDHSAVISELLQEVNLNRGSEEINNKTITPRPGLELTNQLLRFLEREFSVYFTKSTGLDLVDFETNYTSWAMGITDGLGLEPHGHSNSQFTMIYYLTSSEAELVIQDPRVNARRGYPKKIREVLFNEPSFKPIAGYLLIIPSFLMHYVRPKSAELRVSLAMDVYVNEKGDP